MEGGDEVGGGVVVVMVEAMCRNGRGGGVG